MRSDSKRISDGGSGTANQMGKDVKNAYNSVDRRSFAKTFATLVGGGSVTALSGCLGNNDGSSSGEEETWEEIESNLEDELTINSWGGSLGDVIEEVWISPFQEEYDIDVEVVTGRQEDVASITQSVETGNSPGMDVSFQQMPQYHQLVEQDVLQSLPAEQIPVKEDLFDICKLDAGLGNVFYTVGIAYNTEAHSEAPTSWNDLWNDQYEGNIGMDVSQSEWALEISNLAAGRDMYPWDEETWDKLWELRSNIPNALAQSAAETDQLFQEETITMGVWFNGRTHLLADEGFPIDFVIPEEGGIPRFSPFVVYDTAESPNAAKAYINFVLQEEQQKNFAQGMYYASTNKNVSYSSELEEKAIPNSPEQMEEMNVEDWDYITENKEDTVSDFEQWRSGDRN